jgi:hypothetical protein
MAQRSIEGSTALQAEITRLANGSPPSVLAESKHNVVQVVFGLQVQQQRRITVLFKDCSRH